MKLAFWRPRHNDADDKLEEAHEALAKIERITDEQAAVSTEIRRRLERNHISDAIAEMLINYAIHRNDPKRRKHA